jgi:alpha-beta hydrolase superfamily lysophospholipase
VFGWLHRASRPSVSGGGLGLVLCNPFGYEAVCAHRSLRHFAEAAAAAGVPALRFDYDGTGDSAGGALDSGRIDAWVASTRHAVETLRAATGVERVVLLGVRLGALVAALAGVGRDDIDSLIAIAPVVNGKPFLRELRALQMTLPLGKPPAGAPVDETVQESLGFPIGGEMKEALGKVDLSKLAERPAPSVLLLERDDLPGNDAWPQRLNELGVTVERRRLPGYVEMVLGAEHSLVPERMLEATLEWLARAATPTPKPHTATGKLLGSSARIGSAVTESAELIDPERRLFGIFTRPARAARGRGILLLNAGAVHRIGPNRIHVELARRWAALGHTVLRLDISGIGDSLPETGQRENVVYTDNAIADVKQGIAALRRQPAVASVTALGLCSGGYHAFKAAVAGAPLDGALLINPLTFFFKPDQPIEKSEHEVSFESRRYLKRALDVDAWKKLLRGGVHLDALAEVMARRVLNLGRARLGGVARRFGLRVADDLEGELLSVTKRKLELRMVFAGGDPGIELLQNQAGAVAEKLRRSGQLETHIIEGPDHTFTPLWSQKVLSELLGRWFDAPI